MCVCLCVCGGREGAHEHTSYLHAEIATEHFLTNSPGAPVSSANVNILLGDTDTAESLDVC